MNKIFQIQFQFVPVEDRLLLKMNTTDKEEFSFFLTRRYVSLLYPFLTKLLQADSGVNQHQANNSANNAQNNKPIRDEMVKLQQQGSIEKTHTNVPYQNDGLSHPLGNEPILLANISTNTNSGELKLSLTPEKGQGVSFSLDQNLTHLLRNLLLESLKATDWQLKFPAELKSPTLPVQIDKQVLH